MSKGQSCDIIKARGSMFLTSRKTGKKGKNQGGNERERKLLGFQSFVKSPVAKHTHEERRNEETVAV